MFDLTFLNLPACIRQMPCDVAHQSRTLGFIHQTVKQSRLFEVVGAIDLWIFRTSGRTLKCFCDLSCLWISDWTATAVWRIVRSNCSVPVDAHLPVALIVVY